MKILRVKGDRLLPVQNGGNMRSLHFARRPAQHHSLTFFSYYSGTEDCGYETELTSHFPDSLVMFTQTRSGRIGSEIRLACRGRTVWRGLATTGWFVKGDLALDLKVCPGLQI